jgi:hypothetical protein
MAELSTTDTATATSGCCGPEQQATCCEPSAQADCCDPSHREGCGCDAGNSSDARRATSASRYVSATQQPPHKSPRPTPGAGCCALKPSNSASS